MNLVELLGLYSHKRLERGFRHGLWAVRILSLPIACLPRVEVRPAEVHVVFLPRKEADFGGSWLFCLQNSGGGDGGGGQRHSWR